MYLFNYREPFSSGQLLLEILKGESGFSKHGDILD